MMKIQNFHTPLVTRTDAMKAHARRFILGAASLMLGLFLATGCGVDHSPLAQDTQDEKLLQAQGEEQSLLTFSALQGAAKVSAYDDDDDDDDNEPLEDEEDIGKRGGRLEVEDRGGPGGKDDLKITFTVPRNALDDEEEITMRVYGRYLSELVVAFEPSGLVFLKDAKLKIHLGKDLIDLDLNDVKGEHHYGDGSSEEADLKIARDDIEVKISGFSRYSLGRGRR